MTKKIQRVLFFTLCIPSFYLVKKFFRLIYKDIIILNVLNSTSKSAYLIKYFKIQSFSSFYFFENVLYKKLPLASIKTIFDKLKSVMQTFIIVLVLFEIFEKSQK